MAFHQWLTKGHVISLQNKKTCHPAGFLAFIFIFYYNSTHSKGFSEADTAAARMAMTSMVCS